MDDLIALRRTLHAHPETGLDLPRTQRTVLDALGGLDLEISTGRDLSSITAVLRGGRPGPAVLLRADMDALPVTETSGLDYASRVDGTMHACGHDLHTAMLVGAAHHLAAHRDDLPGDVVLMFQPGEEGYDGAARMIAGGVLDAAGTRVIGAYAMHVQSSRAPAGVFHSRPGPMMSGVSGAEIVVHGAGGHAAFPHLAQDPITVAAEIVLALQTQVTRRYDAFDPVIVTTGAIHAGTTANTIPADARLSVTIRTFSPAMKARAGHDIDRLAAGIAAAHGLKTTVTHDAGYPVTVNDPAEYEFAAHVAAATFGPDRFAPLTHPLPAAEDFGRVLEQVPGCYLVLGATVGDPATAAPNHSPHARFDDAVLHDGARLLATLATEKLRARAH